MKQDRRRELELVGALLSGDAGEEDIQRFRELSRQDDEIFRLYLECLDTSMALDAVRAPESAKRNRFIALAAAIPLVLGIGIFLTYGGNDSPEIVRQFGSCSVEQGVRTIGQSMCDVDLPGKARLRAYPETALTYEAQGSSTVFTLQSGRALIHATKQSRESGFEVRAGRARIIFLGTTIDVLHNDRESKVFVLEGAVRVIAGECEKVVEAGQTMDLNTCDSAESDLNTGKERAELLLSPSGDDRDNRRLLMDDLARSSQSICRVVLKDGRIFKGIVTEGAGRVTILTLEGQTVALDAAMVQEIGVEH